ncbi:MAG: amino acid adenylation domain-containing protein, partial [Acutalibacteraceae bacterium]|nr:amino acid adenylation domain-containing protein [Acutalibacteraceae bacterium]
KGKTIAEMFEEQVEKTPENIAVVYGEEKLTYRELNEKANALAYKLRESGVERDNFVAILAERSIEMIIGILGITKSGGAYVPIDPLYPSERIKYMLDDCKPKVVISCCFENKAEIPTDAEIIDLSEIELEPNGENPEHINTANDLAYCIYTSGTTGKPKGVMVEHYGVGNLREYFVVTHNVNSEDNVLQFASFAFDAMVSEMSMSILTGATMHIIAQSVQRDVRKFEDYVADNGITIAILPPIYLAQANLKGLRTIITAGSETNQNIVNANKHIPVYSNDYGPTEVTVCATYWKHNSEDEVPERVPIGKPMNNKQVYIMNGMELCGIGVPGELCIAGIGIARGYLNQPELTAEKFVKNPYGEGRMYRSGDLARWLPDGNIEYLGRIDEQVKIRGFRIELGEIESRIREIEAINDCAVIARTDKSGDKAIYAYYTSDLEINMSDIRETLAENLPEYMIPSYMMQIEKIPVTTNGKLDKKLLPDITSGFVREYKAPRNDAEKVLCKSFEEVLGVEKVGIFDSFFELGGDSIKAIRIISKLREDGFVVTVRDIMNGKIVEKIALTVQKNSDKQLYEQGEISGEVEKTPIIKMFERSKFPIPEHYNQASMYSVNGIDNQIIRRAIEEMVKHHDILRAVYRSEKLEILSISESKLFDFYEFDYTGNENSNEDVEDKCTEIQGSIDLENGPLVKVAVFTLGNEKIMMLCMHHLVIDAVSWHIISEDFDTVVEQLKGGKEIKLPNKTASFIEWSRKLKEYGENIPKSQKDYWKNVVSELEEGKIQSENASENGENYTTTIQLSEDITKKLLDKSVSISNAKIDEILISGIATAMRKITGQDKLSITLEAHGREESIGLLVDRTIGWFTCVYPVVVSSTDDIKENIIKAKENVRKAALYKLGYSYVKDELDVVESDIEFNYLGEVGGSKENVTDKYSFGLSIAEENVSKVPISINGGVFNGRIVFFVSTNKFDENFINEFSKKIEETLIDTAVYCDENIVEEKTASDYGIYDLTVNEFRNAVEKLDAPIEKMYGLTPLQEGMLFHNLEDSEATSYVLQDVFKVNIAMNSENVKKALQLLSKRYEVLRTTFIYENITNPKQAVYVERTPEFEEIEANENKIAEIINSDLVRGFELDKDTMLRVKMIHIADNKNVIVWTMHHIITDGWCTNLLFGKFMEYYTKLENTSIFDIEKEILQEKAEQGEYSEYIDWLERKNPDKAREYWSNLLSGYENDTEIKPMEKPETSDNQMNRISLKVTQGVTNKLLSFASENESTISTVLETACGIMLQKYIGGKDVVFGKVTSGRNADIKDIENIVGLFINTIPVRVNAEEDITVTQLLRNQQKQGVESTEYDYCSLAEIQSMTLQGSELIKVLYVFENYSSGLNNKEESDNDSSDDIIAEGGREQTNYSISISGHMAGDCLEIDVMYNPNEFCEKEIRLLMNRLNVICEQIAENPEQKVSNIGMITEPEKALILDDFNATEKSYPSEKTVVEMFEEQVEKTPENTAVIFEGKSITYKELNERANVIAHKLRAVGVKPDDLVAIIAERSIEMIIGIYGIIKAGGAYVPIDPTYPKERVEYITKDCSTKAVLVYSSENDIDVSELQESVTVINLADESSYTDGNAENPERVNTPNDLIYCIYTSGTTGQPKGVMNRHTGLINRIMWMHDRYPLSETGKILQKTTYTFDVSVWEIIWWSLVGASVVMLVPGGEKDPEIISRTIIDNEITT